MRALVAAGIAPSGTAQMVLIRAAESVRLRLSMAIACWYAAPPAVARVTLRWLSTRVSDQPSR